MGFALFFSLCLGVRESVFVMCCYSYLTFKIAAWWDRLGHTNKKLERERGVTLAERVLLREREKERGVSV